MNSVQFVFFIGGKMFGLFFIFFISVISATPSIGQEIITEDLLFSEEIKQKAKQEQLSRKTKQLFNKEIRPLKIDRDALQKQRIETKIKEKKHIKPRAQMISAPFGLYWQKDPSFIKSLGVFLSPTQIPDYANSYIARNLPKSNSDFQEILLTFGNNNELYRIYAKGIFLKEETPNASKLKEQYEMYYNLLDQKYGNAKQTFIPEETIQEETSSEQEENIADNSMWNPKFLSQLQKGTAVLYAVFRDSDTAAALEANVDGDGNSYIAIEYRYIKFNPQDQQNKYDSI